MSSFVNLLDIIYPINSIYITNSTTSPASTIGGTWASVTGAICGSTSNNAKNYGSDDCTLSTSQIPSHTHYFRGFWTVGGVNGSETPRQCVAWTNEYDGTSAAYTHYTGGGSSHSSVQYSYGCYVWKRTA